MNNTYISFDKTQSDVQLTELIAIATHPVEAPSAWMQYGTSPTEIILATSCVIFSIAAVIGAISTLIKALIPVMPTNSLDKSN